MRDWRRFRYYRSKRLQLPRRPRRDWLGFLVPASILLLLAAGWAAIWEVLWKL